MKKLFIVSLTQEIVIVADDIHEAIERAQEHPISEYGQPGIAATEMSYFPADWDEQSIPFGDQVEEDRDRTVGRWIELGAAPALEALKKKLARGTS